MMKFLDLAEEVAGDLQDKYPILCDDETAAKLIKAIQGRVTLTSNRDADYESIHDALEAEIRKAAMSRSASPPTPALARSRPSM